MQKVTKENSKEQESLLKSTEDANINKEVYSELIERIEYCKMVDLVKVNDKWFLAMGLNKITDEFSKKDELSEYIATNWLEICINASILVNQVLKEK
jgi:hypothetical protein